MGRSEPIFVGDAGKPQRRSHVAVVAQASA